MKKTTIEPPQELWMVQFAGAGWMRGSNDHEMACFATEALATAAAVDIQETSGGTFTVVQVLPSKRAKAKRGKR